MRAIGWRVVRRDWPFRGIVRSAAERWLASRADAGPLPPPAPEELPLADLTATQSDEEAVAQRWTDGAGREWDIVLLRSGPSLFVMTSPAQGPNRRLAELALVYSTLARSRDAVVFTDVSGTLLGASPRWRRIYGYEPGEILGGNPRLINSRLHSRNFFQELWQDLTRRDLGTWSGELANRKKNGELVSVWQTITAYRGPDEPIIGYLGIARDLTSYREVQDRLLRGTQELERQGRMKDEQLTSVVHDLKAPLQGIIGHLDLAIEGAEAGHRGRLSAHLTSARGAAMRLDTLVRSLLDLRQAEGGRLRLQIGRVSIHTLLRTSVDLQAAWASRKGITLELTESGPSRPAFVDELRIEEVVANLLSNAVRHSPEGGRIHIELAVGDDGRYRIRFDDEGPGIPEAERERVFEAYRQLSDDGAPRRDPSAIGWGLAISRTILELHGGTIRADRSPQGGCRMEISFPSNWGALRDRLWAAAVFDPAERVWPEISRRLRNHGIPCFVAASENDLLRLVDHELPNLFLADARAPRCGIDLRIQRLGDLIEPPLEIAVDAAPEDPTTLRACGVSGFQPLLPAVLEIFPDLASPSGVGR